jgi:hypothetical protein
MRYLAANLLHNATPMGTIGNLSHLFTSLIGSGKMTKTIFKGDEQITGTISHLKSSIDSYNNALGNIHFRIGIKAYELGIKTHELVQGKYFQILLGSL